MIALLLATIDEARPLLERLPATQLPDRPFETHAFPADGRRPGGVVVISGMGPQQAAAATRYAVETCGAKVLVNVGICGALGPDAEPGHMYRVAEVMDGDAPAIDGKRPSVLLAEDGPWRALGAVRLVSLGKPVFGGEARSCLASCADVVEMEGFAVAEACRRSGTLCYLIKGVSDLADETGRAELRRNLQRVSAALAEQVTAGLEGLGAVPANSGDVPQEEARPQERHAGSSPFVVPPSGGPPFPGQAQPGPREGRADSVRQQAFQSGGSGSLPHAGPSRSGHFVRGCASEVAKSTGPERGTTSLAPRESLVAGLANFIKVEHTIFSLPLLFAGAWLGAGGHWPGVWLLVLIALAGLGARTLGMAMNRILDRRLDSLNPRTAGRELPSGRLTPAQAWGVAAAGLTVYLLACVALGPVCLRLSPIPAAVLISYSLLKRFTSLCHYGIGVCLALGPLGAYVAVTGSTAASGAVVMLALFTFCWISGFDIIYALQDMESDRVTGVHSIPAALGSRGAQAVAGVTHLVAAAAAARLWWLTGGSVAGGVALGATVLTFGAAYLQTLPLQVRFFPMSAIAGIAGSLIPLLGGLR